MAKVIKKSSSGKSHRKIRPALTPETRINQLVSMAMDLVEQRLLDGTASSPESTYFLQLGSPKNELELEKLREENKMLQAKTKSIEASEETEKKYQEVIDAIRTYSGYGGDEDEDYDEYE